MFMGHAELLAIQYMRGAMWSTLQLHRLQTFSADDSWDPVAHDQVQSSVGGDNIHQMCIRDRSKTKRTDS